MTRSFLTITLLAIASLLSAQTPQSRSEPNVGSEPSPMEAFATGSSAHTVWSGEVGRLTRGNTSAVVTALLLEDAAQPAHQIRGVLIDLSQGVARDRIYLDEEALERTRAALGEITEAVARSGIPGNGCMGAKEFWPLYSWPWNRFHELNADFCGSNALVLSGRGHDTRFTFPGNSPADLAAILFRAIGELKQH